MYIKSTYKCDLCNEEFDTKRSRVTIDFDVQLDLCKECAEKLRLFLRNE